MLLAGVSQGILWALMGIGVYLTFRLLDIADLSAEGTFPLGAAICAKYISIGISPVIATVLAMGGGMLAGLVSGLLHTKLKIPALLTGILTMTALYSINLRIMGSAMVQLTDEEILMTTVQKVFGDYGVLVLGLSIVVLVIILLSWFFKTETGLSIIATGDNEAMSQANGIVTDRMKIYGYMLSNACIALSGALLAQNNGSADINMGIGTIVIGLAAIIIGEVLFPNKKLSIRLMTIAVGAIIYRLIIAGVIAAGVPATDLKFYYALILAVCLTLPMLREKLRKGQGVKK